MKKLLTLFLLLALLTSCASPAVSNTLPQSTEPKTDQTKSEEQNTTENQTESPQLSTFLYIMDDVRLDKAKQGYLEIYARNLEDESFVCSFDEFFSKCTTADEFKNMYSYFTQIGDVCSVVARVLINWEKEDRKSVV